eukprot:scaffold18771_cov59-Phaeocystis_antarctica.AAC.5
MRDHIHACRSSDEAVAAGEDLVGPKGANVSLGCVGPGRHGSALASRSNFSTRTGAARKSDTPYGDCFSAMAARSVGVHLSAGASLTWPRGAQGSYYGEEAPPRLHRLSATSREVRRLTRSRKANALLWQPRAGYFLGHTITGGASGAHLVDDGGHLLDELLLLRKHRPLAEDEVDEPGSNLYRVPLLVCMPWAVLSGVVAAAYHELHCAES